MRKSGPKIKRSRNDVLGKKFGMLTIIKCNNFIRTIDKVTCKCDCGKKSNVLLDNLLRQNTESCGCLKKISYSITHRMCGTSEYNSWAAMKGRCYNKNNLNYKKYYGSKGIKVCKKWLKFENFYKDMGPKPSLKHSLERINYNLGYFKNNCKWGTYIEQGNNKKSVKLLQYKKIKLSLAGWSRITGLNYKILWYRLNKAKWNIEKTLTMPIRITNK